MITIKTNVKANSKTIMLMLVRKSKTMQHLKKWWKLYLGLYLGFLIGFLGIFFLLGLQGYLATIK